MSPEKRLVMPGDELAASEEVLPGDGTYDDGLAVRAARMGRFYIDPDEFKAVVEPLTSTPVLFKVGDIVIGQIKMLKPIMAGVEVVALAGNPRGVSGDTEGTLHVSKVADRYIEDVGMEYRLGDIIRAEVIDTEPSLQLSTDFKGGGCIKAFCLRCRYGMKRQGNSMLLECPNCGERDQRNIAADYGYGVQELSPDAPELPQGPRDRGRDGRDRGPRGGGGRGPPRGGRGGGGRGPPRGGRGGGGGRGPPRGGRDR
jgi:exosome complex component CSL4